VLDAAITEFLDKGYEGANVRSILAASGVSAGSAYRCFGSKQGLFREIIENRVDLSYPRSVKLDLEAESIEAELTRFANAYLREFLAPEALALTAMIIAEAEHFPEETQRVWQIGPLKAIQQVEDYLRHHQDRGAIAVEDTHMAAAQFLDLIKGGLHLRQLLGGIAPSPSEIGANVRQAVAIFCGGIAADGGAIQRKRR
jgi:AcrR family transcriptional regulator